MFDRYLTEGGFPGVQNRLNEDRIELLQSYVRDVVARDVAERLGREDIRLANQFALHGLRNTACELSVNQLVESFKELGFKIYWEKADPTPSSRRRPPWPPHAPANGRLAPSSPPWKRRASRKAPS